MNRSTLFAFIVSMLVSALVASAQTYSYQCSQEVKSTYLMDGGSITVGLASSRLYTTVCNSRDNSSGNIRCRVDSDAGTVSTTTGTIGDVLGTGDCISYSNPVAIPIRCIGGGTYLTASECVP